MNNSVLTLYHAMPPFLRSFFASIHGFRLRHWRYGSETEELVAAALEREHWTRDRWNSWLEVRMAYLLHRAATRVPYYREHWAFRRRHGDTTSWELLANWPILEKNVLRHNPRAFLADDCNSKQMFHLHTSGSTGTPLSLWASKSTVRQWFALFEARWRRWYGITRHERWALLAGQLVAPITQTKPPFWVWNAGLNQLYMSSYHLSERFIPWYIEALRRYHVRYLWGYSSSVYTLAHGFRSLNQPQFPLKAAITNAEPLLSYQRAVIRDAFGCPVRETYGNAEAVAAASECEFGNLHLWPEVGWVEVLVDDQPVLDVATGDLVCTGHLNVDMPLIRYRVGDRASIDNGTTRCSCGRSLSVLSSLEGRIDDILYTADGRIIGRLDPIFKANLPIRGAQIIQETLNRVRIRYVPTREFTSAAGQSMVDRLRARMGKVDVVLESLEELPRDSAGKFRAVICNLSDDERNVLRRSRAEVATTLT